MGAADHEANEDAEEGDDETQDDGLLPVDRAHARIKLVVAEFVRIEGGHLKVDLLVVDPSWVEE